MRFVIFCLLALTVTPAWGQLFCRNGRCQRAREIVIAPLPSETTIEARPERAPVRRLTEDRLRRIIRATVRVTVSGVCGSGTVVGRDRNQNAIVLTNAHVAGTQKGRVVQLERWEQDGTSEKGQGTIIAYGYGRGLSVDFALLKCNTGFAQDVEPIPLADRYPITEGGVTTYGCPRCEWPSMQVIKLNRAEGQILSWKPEAIGGRSGSSLIDYTADGPRVVGLLTWAGGGEGLGQSTPFLLSAMRGKLPATLEGLPAGAQEVSCQEQTAGDIFQVPATTAGEPLRGTLNPLAQMQVQDDLLDSIVDRPSPKPNPREPSSPPVVPTPPTEQPWTTGTVVATSAASSVLLLLGLQYGIPLLLQAIRQFRKSGGNTLLSDDQFQQLLDQYKQLLKVIEQNAKTPPSNSA